MPETIEKPAIAPELLEQISTESEQEKQVIVHCMFPASPVAGNLIRIWKSTVLYDNASGHRSMLVHAENISYYPLWTEVPAGRDYWFTLVFTGLPKSCLSFDLIEVIPQEGGFHIKDIRRNGIDVYRVKVSED